MIFIINREYILWEVVELARLHMCEVLKVPPAAIEAKLELSDEKLSPEFLIDADLCKGVSNVDIRQVMERIYKDCKAEMESRLAMADYTRKQYLEKFVWDGQEEKEAATA